MRARRHHLDNLGIIADIGKVETHFAVGHHSIRQSSPVGGCRRVRSARRRHCPMQTSHCPALHNSAPPFRHWRAINRVARPIGAPYLITCAPSAMARRTILWPSPSRCANATATPCTMLHAPARRWSANWPGEYSLSPTAIGTRLAAESRARPVRSSAGGGAQQRLVTGKRLIGIDHKSVSRSQGVGTPWTLTLII